jgi:hypothetical protein
MGSPDWPTTAQLAQLHEAARPQVETRVESPAAGRLALAERLAPLAMMLIEVEAV